MPKKKQNVGDHLQTWVVRDVDRATRLQVRTYAITHDLTTAQALRELVSRGFQMGGVSKPPSGHAPAARRAEEINEEMWKLFMEEGIIQELTEALYGTSAAEEKPDDEPGE